MLSTEFALDNNFMMPVLDFILLWISSDVKSGMILIGSRINLCSRYTVKLYASLNVVRINRQQLPTTKIVETMSLKSKLYSTFTTNLVHELIRITCIASIYVTYTCTLTDSIHSILSRQRTGRRLTFRTTIAHISSLSIHQIDIGETQP